MVCVETRDRSNVASRLRSENMRHIADEHFDPKPVMDRLSRNLDDALEITVERKCMAARILIQRKIEGDDYTLNRVVPDYALALQHL